MNTKVKVEIEKIGPDRARELLSLNTGNRKMSDRHVNRLSLDIEKGQWKLNGETIKISKSGELLDGQNRLTAILKTGIPCDNIVVSGLDDSVFTTIDIGRSRSVADMIHIEKIPNATAIAAGAALVFKYGRNLLPYQDGQERYFSKTDLVDYIMSHKNELIHSARHTCSLRFMKRVMPPSYSVFLYTIFGRIDKELRDEFFEKLEKGVNCEPQSPEYLLREKLIETMGHKNYRDREDGYTKSAYAIIAWNAVRENKPLKQLRWNRSGLTGQPYPRAV